EGRLRMTLSSKSGLSISTLDATNIAGVDFSAKVLEALTDVQKMVKPEKWEVLRPYAEKLLAEEIPPNSDDAAITRYRLKLRELFNKENGDAARLVDKAVRLFDILKTANPYEQEMRQIARLFQTDLTGNDDIYLILYGLKEALDYRAFDEEAVSQSELDDLANRIKNYRDLVHFLSYSGELETAYTYCNLSLPDEPELRRVLKLQQELGEKFRQLKRYIDSDVQLRTELIGRFPPQAGETASRSGTLGVLLQEYISLYCQRHDQLLDYLEQRRQEINQLVQGEEWQALRQLEQISALQPPISATLERELLELAQSLFTCPNSSKTSIEGALRSKPQHECELSFANMTERWEEGRRIAEEAHHKYDESIDHKMEVFLNVTVRQRLRQGESEPVIAGLLKCNTTEKVRAYLTTQDGSIVELINHYLKRIAVKKVRMSDFHPVLSTVEQRQIPELVKEFQQFLINQLQDIEDGDDTLPMLQVE
ncbi:hypothetical protein, partial [Candidatus Chlorohelix sp.]|uniref:hypothetical protein n=1 Tax=Candidatus Chlorohelix sp. TaxID=3139201 RepID=UPI00306D6259